jgi:hypothetical protein
MRKSGQSSFERLSSHVGFTFSPPILRDNITEAVAKHRPKQCLNFRCLLVENYKRF